MVDGAGVETGVAGALGGERRKLGNSGVGLENQGLTLAFVLTSRVIWKENIYMKDKAQSCYYVNKYVERQTNFGT